MRWPSALGVPARFFPAPSCSRPRRPRLADPSEAAFRRDRLPRRRRRRGARRGRARRRARWSRKAKSARATLRDRRARRAPLDPRAIGRPRGRLAVIGLGPGDAGLAHARGRSALLGRRRGLGRLSASISTCWPRASPASAGTPSFALGEEAARAASALDLAAAGRRGRAGLAPAMPAIYGMAALVFELLERERRAATGRRWRSSVSPGVSALQAAAARAGAPLGHDFCAISLSDLLTPWADDPAPARGRGRGRFRRRAVQPAPRAPARRPLARALAILRAASPARHAGRPSRATSAAPARRVDLVPLAALDPAERRHAEPASSSAATRTRWLRAATAAPRVYTPRGYRVADGAAA